MWGSSRRVGAKLPPGDRSWSSILFNNSDHRAEFHRITGLGLDFLQQAFVRRFDLDIHLVCFHLQQPLALLNPSAGFLKPAENSDFVTFIARSQPRNNDLLLHLVNLKGTVLRNYRPTS